MATSSLSPHVSDILNRVDLPRLLIENNVPITWKGTRPWAACWIHKDDHPSVQLNSPERSVKGRWTYYCYGCQEARGDALEAVQTLRNLRTSDAIDYLHRFVGAAPAAGAETAPPKVAAEPPAMLSRSQQAAAAQSWIALLDEVAPQARARAREYLLHRGANDAAISSTGGGWLVTTEQWYRLGDRLPRHTDLALFEQAGLTTARRDGRPRAVWFDDVVLAASRARDQVPLYFWGRRLDCQHLFPDMRYCNQRVGGARHVPYGLDAIVTAAQTGGVVRAVEGPITCLASRSLPDGNAVPTFAVLHRLGWGERPDPKQMAMWTLLLDDLRKCSRVEFCPDNDAKASTLDQGVHLAVRGATWVRLQGVNAKVRLFQEYRGPVEIPEPLRSDPFQYVEKDFAEVACKARR